MGLRSSSCTAMKIRGISGKWKAMWNSSPLPKYGANVRRPLIGFGQKHLAGIFRVQTAAKLANDGVRFRQVFAVGSVALDQIGHGVETEAIDADVEPEFHHPPHGFEDCGVVIVQVRLMAEEAVPIVGLSRPDPRPNSKARYRER